MSEIRQPKRLVDYQAPAFVIEQTLLRVELDPVATRVYSKLKFRRQTAGSLWLDGQALRAVQGVRQAHVFKVPGTYHACVRLSSGAGQVIDKPLSLKVDANRRPLIDTFWSPQVQFGVFDARTRDRQNPVARTYPVRVRIQDDQPASVQVVFSNQQGSVPATLSSDQMSRSSVGVFLRISATFR